MDGPTKLSLLARKFPANCILDDGQTEDIRHLFAMGYVECLLAEHWNVKAFTVLGEEFRLAHRRLGADHATTIGLQFQLAQATYQDHFFGREDYRRDLIQSITIHGGLHDQSARVLGIDHPLTRKVAAGYLRCFEEQLDWSLDDIPREHLEYRARLLGD